MTPFAAMFGFLCLVNVLSGSSGLNPLHGKLPSRKHRVERQANGNIDAALRNPSFVRFQLGCLLDRGSCDRIGHRIKSLLPEMVATGQCSRCSPDEISQAGKVVIFIQEHYPVEYELLEKKYMQDAQLQEDHDEPV